MKKLELKFNLKEWIGILSKLNLTDSDPEDKRYGGYLEHEKPRVIARNEENKIFRDFLAELRQKYSDNKELINSSYGKEFPFPELISLPETKNNFIRPHIWRIVESYENKELYYTLLKNNNQPNYQRLVWKMSDDHRRDGVCISINHAKGEDSLLHIFKSAIALCPPASVQSEFEYFAEQWAQLDGIDSKSEAEEKKSEILQEFHKAMRQTDMFGNGHACSIIYELWCVSSIVYRAFIAVTEHIKEERNESQSA
jgi:hypothetical protein